MRNEAEIRKRINVYHEALAGIYGKDMPYEEERLSARIDEDEWFLNENAVGERVYCPECGWDNPDRILTDACPSCGGPLLNDKSEEKAKP